MKRLLRYSVLISWFLALCASAAAQQPGKVPTIGFLLTGSPGVRSAARQEFLKSMNDLGYVEGKTVKIEYRYAEGRSDRFPDLAADLIRLKVDVIVVASVLSAAAAKQLTATIPIVMAGSDVVGSGLADSLAQPGGNVTGVSNPSPELGGKRLELLKESFPKSSWVAVLRNPTSPASTLQLKEMEGAGRALGLQLSIVEAKNAMEFDNAFAAIAKTGAQALNVLSSAVFTVERLRLVELAGKSRLPAIYPNSDFPNSGGLMSYGIVQSEVWRRAAVLVDKILKGAKPADLPVEQPMKFEFAVNLKTAKQIGVTIPPNVLVRADRVIR